MAELIQETNAADDAAIAAEAPEDLEVPKCEGRAVSEDAVDEASVAESAVEPASVEEAVAEDVSGGCGRGGGR